MTSKICYVVVWCCFNFFQGKLLRSTSTSSQLLCSLIKHYNELTVCVPYVPGSSLMPSSQHSNDSHQCPILAADFVILYYGIENEEAI